eukprot:gnl/TRDRNA2_/TRDRNA2_174119_c0_seq5.p2 gnl/TRDRNA2_/TRDRNA2_174119_c0~~gnl/TRDRNA2_/TRDRNA2_174119_c0_seq5.p2  ORF type:complete len:142 (+),score=19.03 gnl/TRDRNA2_/TRDRNA2_174119_c0_seq5:3-428(+)
MRTSRTTFTATSSVGHTSPASWTALATATFACAECTATYLQPGPWTATLGPADVGVHFGSIGPVGEPGPDWDARGVTWQAVQAMRPALERGLSSGAICGEAGPAFQVQDALHLDSKLVPLYRHMAAIADGGRLLKNPFTRM